MPWSREQLVEACRETVRANDLRECYIRPIAFLGDGEMGLSARPPTRVADRGVAVGRVPRRRGRQARHPAEDELLPALPPEHAAHQGEGGRTLRQLDPRGAGGRASAATTRRCCSTSTATCRRRAARTSSSSSGGAVKTTPLPTVLGGITRDAVLASARRPRHRDPRGALHARRGLPGGRGVLHRHRGRDHPDPGARRSPDRHRAARAGDHPSAGAVLLDRPRRATRATRRWLTPV